MIMNVLKNKKITVAILAGFIVGFSLLFAVHFFRASSDAVHYHANFAVYINGERDEFDNFTFYEEVQACDPTDGIRPESRVHMHDFVNHVVHVHADGATWGHFFDNLGYTLGNNLLATTNEVYVPDEQSELTFILNGERTRDIANVVIGDTDALLINYGDESDEVIMNRYESVPTDAETYNHKDDPSACAGEHEITIADRFMQALGIR